MRVLPFPLPRGLAMTSSEHLSAADLAVYIDGTLSDIARQRTERQLSDCAQCREELAACAPLARSLPPKSRPRMLVSGLGVAAAAAIAIGIVALPRHRSIDSSPARERGFEAADREIATVAPRPGSTVASSAIRFTWRTDSAAAGYTVVVTNSAGALVWRHEVQDTSIALTSETTFVPGEFNWRVESSRVNGGTASSQTVSFRVGHR